MSRAAGLLAGRARHLIVAALTLALSTPATGVGQAAGPVLPPERIGSVPLALGEHGDAAAAIPVGASVTALVIYDLATVASAARQHNERNPETPLSPRTAFAISLAATAVPIAAGAVAGMSDAPETGAVLVLAGVVIGPSMGHLYAGRVGRGLLTAGLRLGLGALTGLALYAAS